MAAERKRLRIGLAAYGTGWDQDAWRLPESNNRGLTDPSVISDLAITAERGKLDYLFAGSSLASEPDVLNRVFRWDSAVFAGHAAARTDHVGFLLTYNSSFEHPFHVARQLATLDRFSEGRTAINVVFGIDRQGGPVENFEGYPLPDQESKYRRAAEFTEALYALLHNSWDNDLLLDNKVDGILIRPGSWHPIDYEGEFFRVRGPLNVPPPVQRHSPTVHVGTSPESLEYGAKYAQARFSPYFGLEAGKKHYAEHKARVAAAGGDPDAFLILPGVTFYLGGTVQEARAKYRQILNYQREVELPLVLAQSLGITADRFAADIPLAVALGAEGIDPDRLVALLDNGDVAAEDPTVNGYPTQPSRQRRHSNVDVVREVLAALGDDEHITVRDFFAAVQKRQAGQGRYVGDAIGFADWLEEHLEEEVLDGVQLFPPYHRGPADFFVDHVVPELQRRGIFRTEYESTRLEDNLGLS